MTVKLQILWEVIIKARIIFNKLLAIPWVRMLVAGLWTRTPGFSPRITPCMICGGQSGTGTGFSPIFCIYPVNIISPWPRGHFLAAVQGRGLIPLTWTTRRRDCFLSTRCLIETSLHRTWLSSGMSDLWSGRYWPTFRCDPDDGRLSAPLKCRSVSTRLHGTTSQKAAFFIRVAMTTSYITPGFSWFVLRLAIYAWFKILRVPCII
jgi:hypothetical protein